MPITYTDSLAEISGRIGADECQDLLNWLQGHPHGRVNLAACEHLHAAGLQCMMALKPVISAASPDPWLNAAVITTTEPADSTAIEQETHT
jgi:hypothetical protein